MSLFESLKDTAQRYRRQRGAYGAERSLAKSPLGDISGLLDQLHEGGLDSAVDAWSTGEHHPAVSPDQLRDALGDEHVQHLAESMGVPTDELLAGLSQHLPALAAHEAGDDAMHDDEEEDVAPDGDHEAEGHADAGTAKRTKTTPCLKRSTRRRPPTPRRRRMRSSSDDGRGPQDRAHGSGPLVAAAGAAQAFKSVTSRPCSDAWRTTPEAAANAMLTADRLTRERHRAGPDARWLALVLDALRPREGTAPERVSSDQITADKLRPAAARFSGSGHRSFMKYKGRRGDRDP